MYWTPTSHPRELFLAIYLLKININMLNLNKVFHFWNFEAGGDGTSGRMAIVLVTFTSSKLARFGQE